jgi:hypothetical protein
LAKGNHEITDLRIRKDGKSRSDKGVPPTTIITPIYAALIAFDPGREIQLSTDARQFGDGRCAMQAHITLLRLATVIVGPVALQKRTLPVTDVST